MSVYGQYGMVETADDGSRTPNRGVVLVDAERTVQYRWVATNNWGEWTMTPIHDAYEIFKNRTE